MRGRGVVSAVSACIVSVGISVVYAAIPISKSCCGRQRDARHAHSCTAGGFAGNLRQNWKTNILTAVKGFSRKMKKKKKKKKKCKGFIKEGLEPKPGPHGLRL